MSSERLVHHELCFGCGTTNLFGLLMELQPTDGGQVRGRGFVKQDHQGPVRGTAHAGIVGTALIEAMSFAAGKEADAESVELQVHAPVPVGAFLDVEARTREASDAGIEAQARACVDGQLVARALGVYRRRSTAHS